MYNTLVGEVYLRYVKSGSTKCNHGMISTTLKGEAACRKGNMAWLWSNAASNMQKSKQIHALQISRLEIQVEGASEDQQEL